MKLALHLWLPRCKKSIWTVHLQSLEREIRQKQRKRKYRFFFLSSLTTWSKVHWAQIWFERSGQRVSKGHANGSKEVYDSSQRCCREKSKSREPQASPVLRGGQNRVVSGWQYIVTQEQGQGLLAQERHSYLVGLREKWEGEDCAWEMMPHIQENGQKR